MREEYKKCGAPLSKIYVGDLGYTRCTQPVVKMEDIKNKAPFPRVLACESRRLFGLCFGGEKKNRKGRLLSRATRILTFWKRIFFWWNWSSVHRYHTYHQNATFWKALSKGETSISLTGVERWEEKLSKTRRHGISSRAEQKWFLATCFFCFIKRSISKLNSLFLGKMFQLVISDYEFVARASFIASLENRIVKEINI